MIIQEQLKQILHYDSVTGVFAWKKSKGAAKIGSKAGCLTSLGYIVIGINNRLYTAHRLAWLYINGELPREIDHINGIRKDNRIENLRSVSHSENGRNLRPYKNNRSKVMGVNFYKASKRWDASIKVDYKKEHLGRFDDWFDAVCARKSAEVKSGFHYNHGR